MCEIMEHLVTLSEFLSVRDLHASAAASLLDLHLNVWAREKWPQEAKECGL